MIDMTANEIKIKLITLGVDAMGINIVDGEVSVYFEELEYAHSEELSDFFNSREKVFTDKSVFFTS